VILRDTPPPGYDQRNPPVVYLDHGQPAARAA